MTARRTAKRLKIGSTTAPRTSEAHEGGDADRHAEETWPRIHDPKTRPTIGIDRVDIGAPLRPARTPGTTAKRAGRSLSR